MEEEIWLPIKGFECIYEVSNLGRVKSCLRKARNGRGNYARKEKILKIPLSSKCYQHVSLHKDGYIKYVEVHKLVAIAFLNHTPDGHRLVVDHINGIITDNRVENLRIVTNRFNLSIGIRKDKGILTSQSIGVSWHKISNKWVSSIAIDGKQKYLGIFVNELDAAEAYQNELSKIVP